MPQVIAPVVAVFGSSTLRENDESWAAVRELGERCARAGFTVMTGGYNGAMAAASQGAHAAGGHVIGVTVELFEARGPVNPWVRERIHTPDLFARLRHLVETADAFVAVTGSIGTLTELLLVWTLVSVDAKRNAPIVLMGEHWSAWLDAHRAPRLVPEHLFRHIEVVPTPRAAIEAVAAGLARAGRARPAAEARP